ncbi:MAG: glycosyltransferase family 39 protein [Candidatus Eisenbacteria bacterium]|nr:glycosyltransferase family 39 protein [Candidatus Eisenbacteria bacterium]
MNPPAGRAHPSWLAASLVIAAGVALRLLGITHGLPEFTDEAAPFRWALAMWAHPGGAIDANPHHFIYPSLTLYLHLAVQRAHAFLGQLAGVWPQPADYHLAFALDPTPMAIAARAVGVAADGVTLWVLVRIGERLAPRAGLVAAAAYALSPLAIPVAHDVFTDPVMLAFSLLALDRMLTLSAESMKRDLVLGALFMGLAIGSKYTAAVLLLPFVLSCVNALGMRRGLVAAAAGGVGSLLVLAATTPYALIDRAAFLRDVRFDRVLASEGLLGATGASSGWGSLLSLSHDLALPGALLALLGAAMAVVHAKQDRRALIVLACALAFLAPVLVSPLTFDRYRLPVVACAALLAGLVVSTAPVLTPRRGVAFAGLLVLLLGPLVPNAWTAAIARTGTTAGEARAWCESNLRADELTLLEPYAPRLLSLREAAQQANTPLAESASPAWRERMRTRRAWAALPLPTLVAGRCVVTVHTADGRTQDVTVFEHASDFDRVLYDERLLAGVDVVITSSAQRARFEADSVRYADACAFYRTLDAHYPVAARFESDAQHSGPAITIHRRSATAPAPAPLPLDWWTERIPEPARAAAARVHLPDDTLSSHPAVDAAGEPTPWVRALTPLYTMQLAQFTESLAYAMIQLDRPAPAQRLMLAELWVKPYSQWACLLAVESSVGMNDWRAVRDAVARTRAAVRGAALDPALVEREREALTRLAAKR